MPDEPKKLTWIPFIVYFIVWFSIGLSFPLFSYFLFHKELPFVPFETSDAIRGLWLGVLFASLSIVQFVSAPILGMLSDEKGRKKILLIALAFNILGCFLTNFGVVWENLHLLFIARVFIGIGAGSTAVFLAVISDISEPENTAKNFGLFNAFRAVGYAAGMYLSGSLTKIPYLNIDPLEKPFIVATIGSVLCFLLILFFFKETTRISRKAGIDLRGLFTDLKNGFKFKTVNKFLLVIFIFCFGWSMYWEFMPVTWLKILDLTPTKVGFFYAYGVLINAVSSALLIRPVFNRIRNGKVLLFSILLLGLFISVLLVKIKISLLWFLIPCEQFLIALIYPAALTMVVQLARKKYRGLALGSYNSVKALAFAFSPFSGILMGITFKMPIIIATSFMFTAVIILWTNFRKKIFEKLPE